MTTRRAPAAPASQEPPAPQEEPVEARLCAWASTPGGVSAATKRLLPRGGAMGASPASATATSNAQGTSFGGEWSSAMGAPSCDELVAAARTLLDDSCSVDAVRRVASTGPLAAQHYADSVLAARCPLVT